MRENNSARVQECEGARVRGCESVSDIDAILRECVGARVRENNSARVRRYEGTRVRELYDIARVQRCEKNWCDSARVGEYEDVRKFSAVS